ncbi:MAG: GlcNAc-PI de-N-acetylase [Anaerolineae bacterium]|jgi:LmbE family N-acetylglucosaminyl deacetylase|nr:GlcNAc-PI de-N-acetylase [Anaerolineae bacterium]MBT3714424.1 GlcNAc-PI de-N-acetylase [Anaerolineae bacterium]MBT4309256.1 GlcNAc-PI de-N-acetylase [Anaerolineae bacterium]MBT4458513.1 GlcNAc-PI de-N-acetylase [Anaerolineae bacterium]MBT4842690.1 GlcNAc-PI de-N-acetylase [Anaerolineae bacterium]
MKKKPVILSVLAHPDDESFGMGGTLALYAEQGAEVHLVCATRGEVGEMDEKYMQGFDSIADRRESELRCAAGILGLAGVYFLDYRDSGMPGSADNEHPRALFAQPVNEVAENVVCYIRDLKPDIVLTFDPIGGYRHPDHIAIHDATVIAFDRADDPIFAPNAGETYKPRKLYYHTFSRAFLRVSMRLMRLFGQDPTQFGSNKDIDLESLAAVSFPIHAKINIRSVLKKKEAAGRCHASQGGMQMQKGLRGLVSRLFGKADVYMQAYPPVEGKYRAERDLLA